MKAGQGPLPLAWAWLLPLDRFSLRPASVALLNTAHPSKTVPGFRQQPCQLTAGVGVALGSCDRLSGAQGGRGGAHCR